jgi:hypothetical protein
LKLAALCVVIMMASCKGKDNKTNISVEAADKNGVKEETIRVNNDSVSLELAYYGDIRLNESGTAFASISPKGYIEYSNNDREVQVKSDDTGRITYELENNGKKLDPSSAEGQKFLAEAIREMNGYGMNMQRRIEELFQKGGSAALLAEVSNMRADELKAPFFQRLLSRDSIPAGEATLIAGKIGQEMKSSHPKKELLVKYAPVFLRSPQASPAWFAEVERLDTHDKAETLLAALRQPLSPAGMSRALALVAAIDGDAYKTNVLREVFKLQLNDENYAQALKAVVSIGADNEKAVLLKEAVKAARSEAQWVELVRSAGSVKATAEKVDLLVTIGRQAPVSESLKAAYMQQAAAVTPAPEHQQVVDAIKR